jgi:myo-inositol-1(or 4)-monophosphatase
LDERLSIAFLREIGRMLRAEILPGDEEKEEHGPVSLGASGDRTHPIDRKAEEIVLGFLESSGLPLQVVSEEMGEVELNGGGKTRVVLDPIDGSKNAITGLPLYSTSIAVSSGDMVRDLELGYVLNLVSGDEFWAVRGEGSFRNGQRIRAQQDGRIRAVLYETQNPGRDLRRILPLLSGADRTRCLGSTALDLCMVASSGASLFVNPVPSRSFDYAGGLLIALEAGAVATDIEGGPVEETTLDMRRGSSLLVAANREIHEKAVDLLEPELT